MAKVALYPGSFNPWHEGHDDILCKALQVFDKVFVIQCHNPSKNEPKSKEFLQLPLKYGDNVMVGFHKGLISELFEDNTLNFSAIIRGIRNITDMQQEQNYMYNCEDLGVEVPFCYFLCSRHLSHISSTTVKEIEYFKLKGEKEDEQ